LLWLPELSHEGVVMSTPKACRMINTGSTRCVGLKRAVIFPSNSRRQVIVRAERKPEEVSSSSEKIKSSYFPDVIGNLLWNASTMRNRGQASCNVCKTTGHVTCPDCGGARILSKASARARAQAQAKVAAFLEDETQDLHRDEWLVTNRCPRCHGTGLITCPACGGEGYRK
jgi:hypothetical protein